MLNFEYINNLNATRMNIRQNNIYLNSFPEIVHFLMIDKCNAKCIMCGDDYFNSKSDRKITFENYKIISSNLKLNLCSGVVFAGGGDPLLNMDLLKIISYTRENYPHLQICITTNGIALIPELSKNLLDYHVNTINISINSGTKDTYKRIMQIDGFSLVCKNIKKLIKFKTRKCNDIKIQLSLALSYLNISELTQLVHLGKELGVDSINTFYCRFYPEPLREKNIDRLKNRIEERHSLFYHKTLSDKMVTKAKALAEEYKIEFNHEKMFNDDTSSPECNWPMSQIMIGFSGEVYPCGGGEIHFKDKVKTGVYDFGNALDSPIEDFWNSEIYRNLRLSSKYENQGSISECKSCANKMDPNKLQSHIMRWN